MASKRMKQLLQFAQTGDTGAFRGGKIGREMRQFEAKSAAIKKKQDIGRLDMFRSEVGKDESISEITRSELLKGLGERGGFLGEEAEKGFRSTFAAAREGKQAKFKQRQKSQARTELLADRPGRAQTLLTR